MNMEKSELDPKQIFDFVGYQFDLKEGRVRPTLEHVLTFTAKIRVLLARLTCPVQQLMSLIGLLTATEKQVHLGRLHIRPIHWHLKKQLEGPRVIRKGDPYPPPPQSGGGQCALRPTSTPTETCCADLYRRINRRLGRSLRGTHYKSNLVPSRKQVAHKLSGTKSGLSGPKKVP